MKFIILASLFVLSVVAEAEPEAQHFTAGFVQHHNGAVVPQDTDSVKAAKVQHHSAKNSAYYKAAPQHVVYSNVPAMPLRHYLTKGLQGVQGVQQVQGVQTPFTYAMTPKVQYQTPAHTYAINPFYNFYQPQVYTNGYPMVHHMGKREAEAEPEAEAEADAQFYYNFAYGNYQQYPQSFYSAYNRYPTTYNNVAAYTPYTTGYPYNTGYTYSPNTNKVYSANTNKVYNVPAMPLRHYLTKGLQGVQGVQQVQTPVTRVFKREAEAEAEPEAEAQQFYTNYYGNYQQYPQSFYSAYNRYPTTYNKAAYTTYTTGYPYTTGYTGYPYAATPFNYNTFNGVVYRG